MKSRLCNLYIFAVLTLLMSCQKINIPEEKSKGDDPAEAEINYNPDAPAVDRGDVDDATDAPTQSDGPYRGFYRLQDYLYHYGSADNPLPIDDVLPDGCLYADVLLNGTVGSINNVWIEGYVVGYISSNSISKTVFGTENAKSTNIVIAASASENNPQKCVPIQLAQSSNAQKEVRSAANLAAHPELLGAKMGFCGHMLYYMRTLGMTSTYAAYIDDGTGQPDIPSVPDEPDTPPTPDVPDNPDEPDSPPTGPYHGFSSPATYSSAFSASYEESAYFEDFLPGGCIYNDVIVRNSSKAKAWTNCPFWLRGYIVGCVQVGDETDTAEPLFDGQWKTERRLNTNVIIAQTPDERDYSCCVPVELPNTEVRRRLNLHDNPSLLGREIAVKALPQYYFTTAGMKSTSDCHIF